MEKPGHIDQPQNWRERVEQASREGDNKKLLELARQLATHLVERFESQQINR